LPIEQAFPVEPLPTATRKLEPGGSVSVVHVPLQRIDDEDHLGGSRIWYVGRDVLIVQYARTLQGGSVLGADAGAKKAEKEQRK
jgi:hypothetical protein